MTKPGTRERIAQAADALFYEKGYEATSFSDIAEGVGITRGNFYHHFKSKDAILDAVIARRMTHTAEMLRSWEAEEDPRARILFFIRILLTNQTKIMAFGCPVGTLTTEMAKLDHASRDKATDVFTLFRDWLAQQFAAMGQGEASRSLALHLLGRSQGIAVMASAYRDEDYLVSEVAALETWLETLPDSPSVQE